MSLCANEHLLSPGLKSSCRDMDKFVNDYLYMYFYLFSPELLYSFTHFNCYTFFLLPVNGFLYSCTTLTFYSCTIFCILYPVVFAYRGAPVLLSFFNTIVINAFIFY